MAVAGRFYLLVQSKQLDEHLMLIYSMRTIAESIQLPYLTVDNSQRLVSG